MEYIAIALGAVNLVLLVVVMVKVFTQKSRPDSRPDQILTHLQLSGQSTGDEFARSREELTRNFNYISEKVQKLTVQNYEQQNKMMETLSEHVRRMQESNEKKLDEMRRTVDEKLTATLKDRLDSSFKSVSENLEKVYKSLGEMKELAGGVSELQRALTNVKIRGTWAEVQLGNILEQTLTADQYACNVSPKDNGQFVEYAIKIPSKEDDNRVVWLPIDSKFPQDDYIKLCEASERADREACERHANDLGKRILSEAITIKNSYIHVPNTTDFAILFLPTEGLYAEILRRPGLVERIQNDHRVMICGPTTITAFLNTLRMGFRTIALDKRAAEVWKVLGAAKSQYDIFETVLAKAKKKVDEASDVLDDAQKRNSMIQRKLKNVETISQSDGLQLLEAEEIAGQL